jgi:hypothetical protein
MHYRLLIYVLPKIRLLLCTYFPWEGAAYITPGPITYMLYMHATLWYLYLSIWRTICVHGKQRPNQRCSATTSGYVYDAPTYICIGTYLVRMWVVFVCMWIPIPRCAHSVRHVESSGLPLQIIYGGDVFVQRYVCTFPAITVSAKYTGDNS